MKGVPLPDDVGAWFGAIYGDTAEVIAYRKADLRETSQAVHRVKAIRKSDQQPVDACFDVRGVRLSDCGRGLRVNNGARMKELRGSVDDELQSQLFAKSSDDLTDISVWLKVQYEYPPKEELLADPAKMAAAVAAHEAAVADARKRFLAQVPPELAKRFSFPAKGPVAYASLTRSEINTVSRLERTATTSLQKKNEPMGTMYKSSSNASSTGYDGNGVGVCVIEPKQPALPNSLTYVDRYCAGGATDAHARWVAGLVRMNVTPNGLAPGASVYLASWSGCDNNAANAISYCANRAVKVWNFSESCTATDDRLLDYYAKNPPYAFSSVAAGNKECPDARATPLCRSFNTLIVGSSNENGTTSRGDDTIGCNNRDLNPGGDRELPHLVAPGMAITADQDTADGTSGSAPMVAGAAAQLHQKNVAISSWPEATRAVLMASATENVDGVPLNLADTVDDRDGAGELSVADALYVGDAARKVDGGNTAAIAGHDYGTISSSVTPAGSFYSEVYNARSSSWHRMRVVLTWDASTTCSNLSDPTATACTGQTLDGDLDLFVYRKSDGALMATSASSDNSFEFVEFDVVPNTEYEIKIRAYSWNASSTYYGLAWYITNHSTQ